MAKGRSKISAPEENFRLLRDLHQKNLLVPMVGDFAGYKALDARSAI